MKNRTKTDMIVLHCSATPEGRDYKASDIKKWHKQQGWEDIGYHYVIDLDGTIEQGRDESLVGAHCSGYNSTSIGVCYIGGCDKNMTAKDTRTDKQKESLLKIVDQLLTKYKLKIDNVFTHNYLCKGKKACPSFKQDDFRKEYLNFKIKDNLGIGKKKCPHCGKELD